MINSVENRATLPERHITGTHYYVICPRKLWWLAHGMEQEHVTGSVRQENVALGSLLHQESYRDKARKDILVDGLDPAGFHRRWQGPRDKKV